MIGRRSKPELLKWVYNPNQVFTAKFKLFASFSQDRGSILALRLIITSAQNQRGSVDSSSHFYVFAKCIQHFPSSRLKCINALSRICLTTKSPTYPTEKYQARQAQPLSYRQGHPLTRSGHPSTSTHSFIDHRDSWRGVATSEAQWGN